mgnify:CR=1 FL=1
MLENNLVLKNFSCIDDSELAESQGGIGVVATGWHDARKETCNCINKW